MRVHKLSWQFPLMYALIAFSLCVLTIKGGGWRSDAERNWDLYIGFPAAILRGEGYLECPTEGYVWCDVEVTRLAYRLPTYPLFLTAILAVAGLDDPLPKIRLMQAVLAGVLIFLITHYTQRLFGRIAALIAFLFVLLGSPLLWFTTLILTELLFAVLIMALLYMWTFYSHRSFWLGVLLALAMLTKGTLVFTAPLLLLLIPRRYWLPLALGFGLIVGSWALRNYLVLGSFVPFSTGSGAVLLGANNPIAWGNAEGQWLGDDLYSGYREFDGLPEVDWDRAQQRAAIEFVLSQPIMSWFQIGFAKLRLLFAIAADIYLLPLITGICWILFLLLRRQQLQRRGIDVFASSMQRRAFAIMGVFWLGLLVNTVIFWGDFRFRFPFDSLAAIATGALFSELITLVKFRRVRTISVSLKVFIL